MGVKNIRLASMLSFDDKQEADIVNLVESLNASHRMGEFMSNLIRLAFDNPEIIEKTPNGQVAFGNLMRVIANYGRTPDRKVYVDAQNKQLLAMQEKVDAIYNMCMQMYTMAEAGKILGFESKVENMIIAEFALEQQLGKLKQYLGAECVNKAFASNRINNVKENAADNLEYIVSCYEPIINALKQELKVKELEIKVKELEIPVKTVEIEKTRVEGNNQPLQNPVDQPNIGQIPLQMPVNNIGYGPNPMMMYNQQWAPMMQQGQMVYPQMHMIPNQNNQVVQDAKIETQNEVKTETKAETKAETQNQEEKKIKLDKSEEILADESADIEFSEDNLDDISTFFGGEDINFDF